MTIEELHQLMRAEFDQLLHLTRAKGHDYSGTEDTLKNLKACEALGICTAEQGVLVRVLDKLSRLAELCKPGNDAAVIDERIEDTSHDAKNYLFLFDAIRQGREDERSDAAD